MAHNLTTFNYIHRSSGFLTAFGFKIYLLYVSVILAQFMHIIASCFRKNVRILHGKSKARGDKRSNEYFNTILLLLTQQAPIKHYSFTILPFREGCACMRMGCVANRFSLPLAIR